MKKYIVTSIFPGAITLLVVCAATVSSQTVIQPLHAFDGGGGKGTGSTLTVRQSIGQPFTQKGAGASVVLDEGFLPPGMGNSSPVVAALLNVTGGWNMLSVPLAVYDFRKVTLFPTAVSNAFMFTTQYVAQETLKAGVGYWVKFRGAESVNLSGTGRTVDTVDVLAGWNLIGSLSEALAPTSVASIPGGMVVSNFFSFEGMYVAADSLRPGKAYWVKVSGDGVLVLSTSVPLPMSAGRVRIVPDDDHPPDPPGDALDGGVSGRPGELPTEYALYQNYPNPFNPATVIRFALPEASHVILRVYNILGEEMATLVDGDQGAGYREVEFATAGLPSGVYWYRMNAASYSSVKKMMVLK